MAGLYMQGHIFLGSNSHLFTMKPSFGKELGTSMMPCKLLIIPKGSCLDRGGGNVGEALNLFLDVFELGVKLRGPRTLKTVNCVSTLQASQRSKIEFEIPKFEISTSSYDTAWVAMVPSPASPLYPCFPECLEWIMENQQSDGSWSAPWNSPLLVKDSLSSTLACIIALKKWGKAKEHIERGLNFIQLKSSFAVDDRQHSLIGFNIIFPGMIEYAKELGLGISLGEGIFNSICNMRDLELKRGSESNCKSWEAYLAFVAEGLGSNLNWERMIKFQRKNGSLFNSPSTTAAALLQVYDARSLQYLRAALNKYGNAVPAVYPIDIYTNLHVIDSLQKLGIAFHFQEYIENYLSETYRIWSQNDEDIHLEVITFAIAFRLLRMHGYNISSVAELKEVGISMNSLNTSSLLDISTALKLFMASQLKVSQTENIMDELSCSSNRFLKHAISDYTSEDEISMSVIDEVKYALEFPSYMNLERLEHKRNIENYRADNVMILKTCTVLRIESKDILSLAIREFDACQSTYQEELQLLERWYTESKLDQLKFARQKLVYCYFSSAATIFSPEMSDARISWAKNSVLATIIDDFFDVGGSQAELASFQRLLQRWDTDYEESPYSEHVQILFSALYTTVNDLGQRTNTIQGYNITKQLTETWVDLIDSMMKESEWLKNGIVPSMDEYMINGCVSFALGPIILPTLYFIGPRIPPYIIREPECRDLFRLVSICGRLLNDIQGFEREHKQGKLSSMTLLMAQNGATSKEDAKRELMDIVNVSRTELLRMVLLKEGSVVPRDCKDLFWKISRILHFFYARNDGFSSPTEMVNAVNSVIYAPLKIPPELSFTIFDKKNEQ